MSVLENIVDDESPSNISVDFSQFTHGAKYTTMFKELKAKLGIDTDDEMLFHCIAHCIKEHKTREIKTIDLKERQLEIMTEAKNSVSEVNSWEETKIES